MNLELKMVDGKFNTYLIKKYNDELGGVHYIFRFPNNYGASVIKGRYTYGGSKDLWEMALLYFQDAIDDYDLTYEKDFEDDALGYLTTSQVNELLGKIIYYDESNEGREESEPEEAAKGFHCGVEESGGHAYNCNDCPNKCEEWHKWNKEG